MRRPSIPKLRRPSLPKPSIKRPSIKRPPLRVLVLVVVAIVAVVLLLRACDSSDEKQVRQTVERFGDATRDKDSQALCDDLLSTAIVEQLRSTEQPCEVSVQIGLRDVKDPTLEIRGVKVDGDKARVDVDSGAAGQRPSSDTVELVKEDDGWRISKLLNQGSPDPAP